MIKLKELLNESLSEAQKVNPTSKKFLKGMKKIKVKGLGGWMPGVDYVYVDGNTYYFVDSEGDHMELRNISTIKKLHKLHGNELGESVHEATPEEEDEFHTKLDKLVHKTFGHSSDEEKMNEAKDMTFTDYLKVLDSKFLDGMKAVRGDNGSDAAITPTRGDILQNFTLFRNYISSLTKKYKGDKTKLRFLTETVREYELVINESVVNEAKEPEVITQLRKIVKDSQNDLIKDPKSGKKMRVDLTSASAVTQVYDALKQQSNKDKFVSMGLVGMVNTAFKLINKQEIVEYDVETLEELNDFNQFMKEYKSPLTEAEYQGRKVELGKIMQGDVKKFKVYVKNDKGNVVKVNFGQKGMVIKKDNPDARKSFRARHNCDNPGPRWKARYWSCRKW